MLTQAIELFTAIAVAAQVPAEVKVSREYRNKAKSIGDAAKKLAAAISRIDGPVDTPRERRLMSTAAGLRAELAALGVDVSSINLSLLDAAK